MLTTRLSSQTTRLPTTRLTLTRGFTPIPNDLIDYFFTKSSLSCRAIAVYLVILRHSNRRGVYHPIPISASKIAARLGCSEDTVYRALKELEEKGFLLVDRTRHFNVYLPVLPASTSTKQIITTLDDILPLSEIFQAVRERWREEPSIRMRVMDDLLLIDEELNRCPKIGDPEELRKKLYDAIESGNILEFFAEIEMLENAPADAERLKKYEEELVEEQVHVQLKDLLKEVGKSIDQVLDQTQGSEQVFEGSSSEVAQRGSPQQEPPPHPSRSTASSVSKSNNGAVELWDQDVEERRRKQYEEEQRRKELLRKLLPKRLPAYRDIYEAFKHIENDKATALDRVRAGEVRYIIAAILYDYVNSNGRVDPEIGAAIIHVGIKPEYLEAEEKLYEIFPELRMDTS